MASSVLKNNIKRLQNSLSDEINYRDLNFDLSTQGILRRGLTPFYGDAITVAYIMWLRSMPGDFIRQPNYGGFFRGMLNRYPFDPASENQIANDLKAETAAAFPAIELLNVTVKCLIKERAWKVNVAVRDKNSGMVGTTINADLDFDVE